MGPLAQHSAESRRYGNKGVLAFSTEEQVLWVQHPEATALFPVHTGWVLTGFLIL